MAYLSYGYLFSVRVKVKKASTQCRSSTGECDLAEYCNGETEYCPHDVHRKNGEPCRNSQVSALETHSPRRFTLGIDTF